MKSRKNDISQNWHLKTCIVGFLKYYQHPANRTFPTIRHKLEKLDLKIPWPWAESHYKLKNSLSKIIQLSPSQITFGQFFARRAIFARHHFLWVLYLSILGRVFVMYHFCKVPLFSNGTKECFFCWVLFLLGLSDGVVFCFF